MYKVKFKAENNNDKINTQKQNKMELVNKINQMIQVLHKLRTMKKCYCCSSGIHMLDNCDIRGGIAIDRWFYRTGNSHSHHQQEAYTGDEQTVEGDADVSLSSTKTSGWRGLQIRFHERKQVTTDGSDLR